MSDYDMKIHSNPDAQAWAKFFIQTKKEASWQIEDIDESLMLGWFANAMMAMHDHLKSQRTEPVCCQKYDTCLEPCTPRGEHLAQRTWVGLTDEDISEIVRGTHNTGSFVRAIEAKLKELNT